MNPYSIGYYKLPVQCNAIRHIPTKMVALLLAAIQGALRLESSVYTAADGCNSLTVTVTTNWPLSQW